MFRYGTLCKVMSLNVVDCHGRMVCRRAGSRTYGVVQWCLKMLFEFLSPGRIGSHAGVLLALTVAACGGEYEPGSVGSNSGEVSAANGIFSDDFHTGSLDTQVWQVVDPQGDGSVDLVGAGTPDAHLRLSVPAGTDHDAWTDNTSLRVMQPAEDEDLEVEVKFESQPTQAYQSQGLIVQQDPSNYVRFDVYSSGGSLKIFTATFANGSASIYSNDTISLSGTTYLRLGRVGNQWTAQYSSNGTSWATAASFSHSLAVSSVGPFAGNFSPAPAFTAVVDYFAETSAPIVSEDPPLCDPADLLLLTTQATNGTILRSPDQSSYGCGDVVTLTARPDPGSIPRLGRRAERHYEPCDRDDECRHHGYGVV